MEISFNSLRDFFRAFFGIYTPISYVDSSGVSIIPSGLSGVDFEFVLSVLLFALIVYCLFRLLGFFISRH